MRKYQLWPTLTAMFIAALFLTGCYWPAIEATNTVGARESCYLPNTLRVPCEEDGTLEYQMQVRKKGDDWDWDSITRMPVVVSYDLDAEPFAPEPISGFGPRIFRPREAGYLPVYSYNIQGNLRAQAIAMQESCPLPTEPAVILLPADDGEGRQVNIFRYDPESGMMRSLGTTRMDAWNESWTWPARAGLYPLAFIADGMSNLFFIPPHVWMY